METRDKAYKDFQKGMKYKDIAEKYGVSVNTIKSWASRYWKNTEKVATKNKKGCNLDNKKLQPKPKPRGAPKGNKNAVGSPGGNGAPIGNQHALKHGGYSPAYYNALTDEEKSLIDNMPVDEETMLQEEIHLLSIRELRIMNAINQYRDMKGGLYVDEVVRREEKKKFNTPEDEARYQELREEKISESKVSYLYDKYEVATMTKSVVDVVIRLEGELTRVQRAKLECTKTLAALRAAKNIVPGEATEDNSDEEEKVESVIIYLPDNGRDK